MGRYSQDAVERAMKVQEVILRAVSRKLQWFEAAEIIGGVGDVLSTMLSINYFQAYSHTFAAAAKRGL